MKSGSHPAGVRGLKPGKTGTNQSPGRSHPAGVRGLKLPINEDEDWDDPSHPAGVRGLKHNNSIDLKRPLSRTPQGCVD